MNGFALTLKDNWLRLPFNPFKVRLKGNDRLAPVVPLVALPFPIFLGLALIGTVKAPFWGFFRT